jgi:hypothetical protein
VRLGIRHEHARLELVEPSNHVPAFFNDASLLRWREPQEALFSYVCACVYRSSTSCTSRWNC